MKKRHIIFILLIILSISLMGFTVYKGIVSWGSNSSNNSTEVVKDISEEFSDEKLETEIVEEPKISNIRLLAVGDIMFHSPQYKAAYDSTSQAYDFYPTFRHIESYIKEADIALGNFETVTAGDHVSFQGYPRFNTPKESLMALKDVGFNILSTANNHSLDHGKDGLVNTIKNIQEYGMKNIGTYKEKDTPILVEEIENIKIGFLSYTYGLNGMDFTLTEDELSFMVNLIDEEKIKVDIEKTKELGVDLTVVFIHWGNEYHREPSTYQIELGEKMVEWGANIILGSHPHVIQNSQIIHKDGKDNFIIYSMGNFLSNQRMDTTGNSYTEDGVMVSIEIEKDFSSGETLIKNIYYIPTWVHKYRDNDKLFFEILPIKDLFEEKIDVAISDTLKNRIKKSYDDTMEKMTQN